MMRTAILNACLICSLAASSAMSGDLVRTVDAAAMENLTAVRFPGGKTFCISVKSEIDGTMQPCLFRLPRKYNPRTKYPLLVTLHGYNDGPILAPGMENVIQIGPTGRGSVWYEGVGEKDVFECIELAKRLFSVNADRIYLCGFSMGGCGTFRLAFRRPDMWAACVPVCGKWDDEQMIRNADKIPFWINTGQEDDVVPASLSKCIYDKACQFGIRDWRYTEHPQMGHSFAVDWTQTEKWLLEHQRITDPKRVRLATYDMNSDHAHWVWILGIAKYGQLAEIDARIDGQSVYVNTSNVSNYKLVLNRNLIDLSKDITIIENGVRVRRGIVKDNPVFIKSQDQRQGKRYGLCGPIWDIYSHPCVLVCPGSVQGDQLRDAARQCARSFIKPRWLSGMGYKIIDDDKVSPGDLADSSVVLFGDPGNNRVLRQISDNLPIRWKDGRIVADGKEYAGRSIGFLLIYPNPKNPNRYVLVFSGNSPESVNSFDTLWPVLNAPPKTIDAGIFEITPSDAVVWHKKAIFGSHWQWQP